MVAIVFEGYGRRPDKVRKDVWAEESLQVVPVIEGTACWFLKAIASFKLDSVAKAAQA